MTDSKRTRQSRRFHLFLPLFLLLILLGYPTRSGAADLSSLQNQYRQKRSEIEAPLQKLFQGYIRRLQTLREQSLAAGDQQRSSLVDAAIHEAKTNGIFGEYELSGTLETSFPDLAATKKILIEQQEDRKREALPGLLNLLSAYGRHLGNLESELSGAGNASSAEIVRAERKKIFDANQELAMLAKDVAAPSSTGGRQKYSGKLVGAGQWRDGEFKIPGKYSRDVFIDVDTNYYSWVALQDNGRVVSETWHPDYSDVPSIVRDAIAVHSGNGSHGALLKNGSIKVWGFNHNEVIVDIPPEVEKANNIVDFGIGWAWAAVLDSNGVVTTWGPFVPPADPTVFTNVAEIAVGWSRILVISKQGTATVVRFDGGTEQVPLKLENIASLTAGSDQFLVHYQDGSLVNVGGPTPERTSNVAWACTARNTMLLRTNDGQFFASGGNVLGFDKQLMAKLVDCAIFEQTSDSVSFFIGIESDTITRTNSTSTETTDEEKELAFEFRRLLADSRFDEAEAKGLSLLEYCAQQHGPMSIALAPHLSQMAGFYNNLGRFAEGEAMMLKAHQINTNELGPEELRTADSHYKLGEFYRQLGSYTEALRHYKAAREIREAKLGRDHDSALGAATRQANILEAIGRYDEAESILTDVLKRREAILSPNHPNTATTLSGLGWLYRSMGQYDKAEEASRRALAMREETLGPEHTSTAISLGRLGLILKDTGRFEEAEKLFKRGLRISETQAGPDHPNAAYGMSILADLYLQTGRYDEALPLYEKAIKIRENKLGKNHPLTALSLGGLARLKIEKGNSVDAADIVTRELQAQEAVLEQMLTSTSEEERLAFRLTQSPMDLVVAASPPETIATTLIRTKGIVLESLLEDKRTVESISGDPRLMELYQSIQTTHASLRNMQLQGNPTPETAARLQSTIESKQRELASELSHFGDTRRSLTLVAEDIQQAVPDESVLLEYFLFRKRIDAGDWKPAYAAVLFRKGQDPVLIDCGLAKPIDDAIAVYRVGIEKSVARQAEKTSRSLYQSLISPALPYLEGVKNLIISPDSQLNFVSFATLVSESDTFVAEDFAISYVSSGRDLLRKPDPGTATQAMLIGGPSFGETLGNPDDTEGTRSLLADNVRAGLGSDAGTMQLLPLPGAEEEVERVWQALGDSVKGRQMSTGASATEDLLRKMQPPRLLHLATHGFFLNEVEIGRTPQDAEDRIETSGIGNQGASIHNPMFRSGIALAGAQHTLDEWRKGVVPDPRNDGILMAQEVVDLNLDGTELVTLSACSTATGETLSGEGVMGLRRGFAMAGAQNLLMTLWPVADKETASFMEDFYKKFAETGSPADSLAIVQKEWLARLRNEESILHAIHRAGPFILSRGVFP